MGLRRMEIVDIIDTVKSALKSVYTNDLLLLQLDVSERAITHKLAEYIQTILSKESYHVDCEYNKDIDDPKRMCIELEDNANKEIEQLPEHVQKEVKAMLIYPDIVIHNRRSDLANLCVIEVKKSDYSPKDFEHDDSKLKCYTSEYKYKVGLLLIINTGKSVDHATVSTYIYQNGKQLNDAPENWSIGT
jgi:hypothetical protein